MARTITYKIKNREYTGTPLRIDRKKLYGWTEILALDEQGRECTLVSTDESGTLIIPAGGTGLGMLTDDGAWVERSQLRAVNPDGSPAQPVESSFKSTVELNRKVSSRDLLDHSITAFYELTDVPGAFVKSVGKDIYTFPYTYLDSYETTPAFVLRAENARGDFGLFMLVGYPNTFRMLSLEQPGFIDDSAEEIEEADDLDFSMF